MNPIRIYSKVDRFYFWFVSVFSIFIIGIHLYPLLIEKLDVGAEFYSSLIICSLIVILLISLPKLTYFEFGKKELTCKTLFFVSTKIPYETIKKLERTKSLHAGLKYTTALHALILSYNKYDDVLIGPKDEKLFVDELLKRNGSVLIEI